MLMAIPIKYPLSSTMCFFWEDIYVNCTLYIQNDFMKISNLNYITKEEIKVRRQGGRKEEGKDERKNIQESAGKLKIEC